jgi:hypothetical protein
MGHKETSLDWALVALSMALITAALVSVRLGAFWIGVLALVLSTPPILVILWMHRHHS